MDMLNMRWDVVGTAGSGTARRRLWLKRGAAITAVGMLLALLIVYQDVLQGAVRGADARRLAAASPADSTPCAALADLGSRQACLSRATASERSSMPLPNRP